VHRRVGARVTSAPSASSRSCGADGAGRRGRRLAWTPNGGDILFVESTRMAGKKSLTLTGSLGDVMKESAQAALSYLRSKGRSPRISPRLLRDQRPARARPRRGRHPEGRAVGRGHDRRRRWRRFSPDARCAATWR
jgi:hypothetical protein